MRGSVKEVRENFEHMHNLVEIEENGNCSILIFHKPFYVTGNHIV